MNTKVILGIVVVLIIGIGAYFLFAKQTPNMQAPATTTTGIVSGPQSIASLVAAGSPVTCTYSTTTAAGTQSGTMYIAQGMVAGDFQMTGGQVQAQGHMIVRAQTSYVWMTMNGKTQAFKTGVNANAQANTAQSQGVNYNAQMNYSCQPWTVDSSKFTLPAGVTFMDTAAMGTPSGGVGHPSTGTAVKGSAGQCATCAELQGATRAQCLAALHC